MNDFKKEREVFEKRIKIGHEILYLTRKEILDMNLSESDILELTHRSLTMHGRKEYEMPAKIGVHPYEEVFYHAMPAYLPEVPAVGIKWISGYPGNTLDFGLPATTGLLVVNDGLTGLPVCIMDAQWITAYRTAGVTVSAAKKLNPDARTFGIVGCGMQGYQHMRLLCLGLKKLEKIYLYDVVEAAVDRFIEEFQPKLDVEIIKAKSPEELTKCCEVITSATVFVKEAGTTIKAEWVQKGQAFLTCDGMSCISPQVAFKADRFFVDWIDEFNLLKGMGYYEFGTPPVDAEIGEVIADLKPGRITKDDIIVDLNIGMPIHDILFANKCLHIAIESGAGVVLPL